MFRTARGWTISALALSCIALTACEGSTHKSREAFGGGEVLLTSADLRMAVSKPANFDAKNGRAIPLQITCAEPSPDIAKAVQESFGLGAGGGVAIPAQGSGEAAIAIASARAEAAAQLGERLATIQLLRDGLYRACEAYANGAFSEVTYAVLLSRYDDTMVSLLMGELAAGNFGRQLAALGGTAESDAKAKVELETALKLARKLQAEADEAREEAEAAAAGQSEAAAAEKEAAAKNKAEMAASAKSVATALAAGAIGNKPSDSVAQTLAVMQRKYIENINADAIVVACVTALSRSDAGSRNDLVDLCAGRDGKAGILDVVVKGQKEMLASLKATAIQRRDAAALESAVQSILAMVSTIGELKKFEVIRTDGPPAP